MNENENLQRLTYMAPSGTVSFAVRSILLSIGFGSIFFIIIPLTSKYNIGGEKAITVRPTPERVVFEQAEEEEIIEEQQEVVEQKNEPIVEMPTPPQVSPPAAAPVNIQLSSMPSTASLHVSTDFKRDFDFKVETISAMGVEQEGPSENLVPVAAAINYNAVFAESAVDKSVRRIKGRIPHYSMRYKRRGIEGRVVISCIVTKEGKIITPIVSESQPKGTFDEACLNNLKYLLYEPATKDGRKVAQRLELVFTFKLAK